MEEPKLATSKGASHDKDTLKSRDSRLAPAAQGARSYLSSTTSGDVDFKFGSDGFCFSFLGCTGGFDGDPLGWL